ncbi:MAG TPA: serine/threonine protein kinase [Methanothermococcus okinawensis]|uniref:Serine/threonine protein kinase n=1 Tax=Methanothermococcus okinawensis TaxID=155863 RepID=A0A832YXR3_9EURY|nr:serine/threonine protein kinase [Methanothermococcus okinawensis]
MGSNNCKNDNSKYDISNFKEDPIMGNLVDWEKLECIIKKNNIKLLEIIGKGHRGVVFKGIFKNKIVAIKVPRINSKNTVYHEGSILEETNLLNIGPKVYKFSNNYLIMEYIEGINLKDYLSQKYIDKKEYIAIIENTLKQCLRLDFHKINHGEIQGGKHIIINNKDESKLKVCIIDFDKSRRGRITHNFTSAISLFFTKSHISRRTFEILNISKDERNQILDITKLYKRYVIKRKLLNNLK